jgi:hypothetical protein
MLTKFRSHHIKRILWALIIIIVPSFILWGALSYFRGQKEEVVGKIGTHPISAAEFNDYRNMARIHFFLTLPEEKRFRIRPETINAKAWQFLLLLWKAKQDNIQVTDQEVVDMIQALFFKDQPFNSRIYQEFLNRRMRITARAFEEYLRKFIMIDKVQGKEVTVAAPTEEEVKEAYKKDTQKAKIGYILIPYTQFVSEIQVSEDQIKSFYEKNKALFKEEPKVKIRYIVLSQGAPGKEEALQKLSQIKSLDELKTIEGVQVKESIFIGINDPIAGLGWQNIINKTAFELKKGEISPPLEVKDGTVLIQKVDEKPSSVPPLESIREAVAKKAKEEAAQGKAQEESQKLMEEIKSGNVQDLEKFAKKEKLDYKETNYFKYSDYIEGVGLDEKVDAIVFSMEPGNIYPEPLFLLKGAYLIQLKSLTPFDNEDFTKNQESYSQKLFQQKYFIAQMNFLSGLQKEAHLVIYATSLQQ